MRLRSCILLIASCALAARGVSSQEPGATPTARGATVHGVVRDSVAHAPLAGAWVQLVPAQGAAASARTVMSDAEGQYAIADVPAGRYTIGFIHPVLDSLGVEPMLRPVRVRGTRPVRADLASPSPARLRAAICAPRPFPDTGAGAVVVGVVRDASDGSPVAGARVVGEWLELTFRKGGVDPLQIRLETTTLANGWFFLCSVPMGGVMSLSAVRGADSTDVLEVQVPKAGFVRRELYVGGSLAVAVRDTGLRIDSLAPPPRIMRVGKGRLTGTVVSAISGLPLAGAHVRLTDGPQTRANDRGEWTLANAAGGTRTLEVRAVGYYPAQRAVHVITSAPPVVVALSNFAAVLDTVRILAARMADRSRGEFEKRRQQKIGRFITADDLAKRNVTFLTDGLRQLSGVRLDVGDSFRRPILVRAMFGGWCQPDIYLDGLRMLYFSADDLDQAVTASKVMGIEIHTEPNVPWQYQLWGNCGVILVWTK